MHYKNSFAASTAILLLSSSLLAQEQSLTTVNAPSLELEECRIILADERLLATGQTGIVAQVHVREGDHVKKGQLLAELESAVPKASLAVAEKQAENDVDVRFAKVAAKVAKAEYELAVNANRKQADTFSQIELEKLRLEKERSELQIEVTGHEYEVAQLKRDEAKAVFEAHQIIAPADGMISRIFKLDGEAIQAGEPLLECKQTDVMRVEGFISVRDLGSVQRGSRVKVIPLVTHPLNRKENTTPEGTIFFVDVSVDDVSQKVRILAEVDNASGVLLAGTQAKLIILTDTNESTQSTVNR